MSPSFPLRIPVQRSRDVSLLTTIPAAELPMALKIKPMHFDVTTPVSSTTALTSGPSSARTFITGQYQPDPRAFVAITKTKSRFVTTFFVNKIQMALFAAPGTTEWKPGETPFLAFPYQEGLIEQPTVPPPPNVPVGDPNTITGFIWVLPF